MRGCFRSAACVRSLTSRTLIVLVTLLRENIFRFAVRQYIRTLMV
jgi:hypothetical protein